MILNHIWGLYTHPNEEWQTIEKRHESLLYSLTHILIISLIPAVCTYFSSAYIGWSIGTTDPIQLDYNTAMSMSIALYFTLILAVFSLAYLIKWMAKTFDSTPNFTQSLELATYAATPLLMVGIATLFPILWFVAMAGLIALAYSIYLLYSGVPIMMNIPQEKGFIYASAVVTSGLVLLVTLMAVSAVLFGLGIGAEFTQF